MKNVVYVNLVAILFILAGCGRDGSQQAAQAYIAPTNQIANSDDLSAEEVLGLKAKKKTWTCTATCRNCTTHPPYYGSAKTSVAAGNKAMQICRKASGPRKLCLVVANSCFKH